MQNRGNYVQAIYGVHHPVSMDSTKTTEDIMVSYDFVYNLKHLI